MIDREVAGRVGFRRRTVEQIRERCVGEVLRAALERYGVAHARNQSYLVHTNPSWGAIFHFTLSLAEA